MEVKKVNICPRCGDKMHEDNEMNSLSRKDNKTYICSECGSEEVLEDAFGDVIYSYSFKQAVEDGLFIKVKEAEEAGFRIPVYFTTNLVNYITPNKDSCEDLEGRTWDILSMLHWKLRGLGEEERRDNSLSFEVIVGREKVKMFAVIQAGVEGEPIIAVMLPEDY